MSSFVDLNRHFLDYKDDKDPEEIAQETYVSYLFGKDTNTYWNDLFKSKITILLGEAGSGKTWELKEQANKQKHIEKYSFFIRLDKLVNNRLDDAIEATDEELFEQWKASNHKGYFFLDSVDEAKLIKTEALHDALQSFTKGIGISNIPRSKVIISSRVSEWRGASDKNEICRTFQIPIESGDKNTDRSPKIVLLAPLDEDQVKLLAEANDGSSGQP